MAKQLEASTIENGHVVRKDIKYADLCIEKSASDAEKFENSLWSLMAALYDPVDESMIGVRDGTCKVRISMWLTEAIGTMKQTDKSVIVDEESEPL